MIKNKSFNDLITFSRASGGGRYNAQGKYEWLGNNEPRFDYDPVTKAVKGLLIEEQRTNLLTYSDKMETWGMPGCNIDRSLPEPILIESGVGVYKGINKSFQFTAGKTYTFSLFCKDGESANRWVTPFFHSNAFGVYIGAAFNPRTGVFNYTQSSATTGVQDLGGGVYRVWVTATATATAASLSEIRLTEASSYLYGGASVAGNRSMYIWGVQLEEGSFPTSYIPSPAVFTGRASSATYFDNTGTLRTAAANVARYDHALVNGAWVSKGLLLEGQSTNLLMYSEQFSGPSWQRFALAYRASMRAPDGTLTGWLLEDANTASNLSLKQDVTVPNDSQGRVVSVYLKRGTATATQVKITYSGGTAAASGNAVLDWPTLSVSGNGAPVLVDVGDGWYRLSAAAANNGTGHTLATIDVWPANWTSGGGTVGNVYIWGAQLEVGDRPTSYIPTPAVFTSRASTKTYFDAQGVMRTAAVDEAAIDHGLVDGQWISKGLSVEGQATNLLTYSNEFTSSVWSKNNCVMAPASLTAPDGSQNAFFASATVSGDFNCRFSRGVPLSAAGWLVTSFVVKRETTDWFAITSEISGAGGRRAWFNLATGSKGIVVQAGATAFEVTSYQTPLGDGWYRCSLAVNFTTTGTVGTFGWFTDNNNSSYVTVGKGGYVCFGQCEAGNTPTSYIPTTTAQVTRAADVTSSAQVTRVADTSTSSQVTRAADIASVNDLSGWFSRDAGTVVVDWVLPVNDRDNNQMVAFAPTPGTGSMALRMGNNGGRRVRAYMQDSANVFQYAVDCPVQASVTSGKSAFTYLPTGDFVAVSGGGTPAIDSTGTFGTFAFGSMRIGNNGGTYLNGHIKSIKYLKRRVSNDELRKLTE